MKRVIAAALAFALCLVACSDEPSEPVRSPLGSPPEPGAVPETDGFSSDFRDRIAESTMRVSGIACGRSTQGSGFAFADHLVATNAHVIFGVDDPVVELVDGTELAAVPVAYDAVRDLAVLRVDGANFVPLPLGTAPDQTVGALFGWEKGPVPDPTPFRIDRPVTVRIDAVGSDERIERKSWLLAAMVESGDSGAALVDRDGVVVGIAYATTTRGSSVGYAVRATELEALIATGFDDNLIVPSCFP